MQNNKLNILITGAGQGIGKNIAIRLSENEYIENLYILSQSDKIFETEEIINGKKNVIALKGDISSQNFFESLKDILKQIHLTRSLTLPVFLEKVVILILFLIKIFMTLLELT